MWWAGAKAEEGHDVSCPYRGARLPGGGAIPVLGGGGDKEGAEMGRRMGRFLDLGEGRLNNGKA
jgi:hypothetical protein